MRKRCAAYTHNDMTTDLISEINTSTTGIRLALWMGRHLPQQSGYRIAALLAEIAATRRNSKLVRAIRLNQSVVLGEVEESRTVTEQVRRVLRNQSRYLFDFYHLLNRPDAVVDKVGIDPQLTKALADAKKQQRGLLLLTAHTSAYDLAGLSLAYRGLKPLVLGVPNPPKSYQRQNRLRSERGLLTLPMRIEALQRARAQLQAGGLVVTGLDRPHPGVRHHPRFFNRPSNLPVAYVRLALKTGARVHFVACRDLPAGAYEINCSEAIEFSPRPQPADEMLVNAEAALQQAEVFIQHDPTQWMMFFPVW